MKLASGALRVAMVSSTASRTLSTCSPHARRTPRQPIAVDQSEDRVVDPVVVDDFRSDLGRKLACDRQLSAARKADQLDQQVSSHRSNFLDIGQGNRTAEHTGG